MGNTTDPTGQQHPWQSHQTLKRVVQGYADLARSLASPADLGSAPRHRLSDPQQTVLDLLHLHGFKCAGTTLIWALQRHYGDALGYVESPDSGSRLPWQCLAAALPQRPFRAVTSHLITLPPPGQLAHLKVAFVRDPIARLASAYRFQRDLQQPRPDWIEGLSFEGYLEQMVRSSLSNYQTRHLSPQEPADWQLRNGWGARPELIDFERPDLFVGVVERYDDSLLVLEALLAARGTPLDLAYAFARNTTEATPQDRADEQALHSHGDLFMTELDRSLRRRADERLDRHLAALPDLDDRRQGFRRRCAALAADPPDPTLRGQEHWDYLGDDGWVSVRR